MKFFKHTFIFLFCLNQSLFGQHFEELDPGTFLPLGYSVSKWGDYDMDGHMDLFLMGTDHLHNDTSIIYRNNGDGTFTNMLVPLPGLVHGDAAWGDFDNDGDLDLLISGRYGNTRITRLYRNDGNNIFTPTEHEFPGVSFGKVNFHDYNKDGKLDILIAGLNNYNEKICKIYQNNNGNYISDLSIQLPGISHGAVLWGDFDKDGLDDLLLSGADNSNNKITRLYKNNGNRSFTEISIPGLPGLSSGSASWGDYDNDGKPDLLIAGADRNGNNICRIYRNNGGNSFTRLTTGIFPGVTSCTVSWGDFDNDGLSDVLINGHNGTMPVTKMYRNNGNDTFGELSDVQSGLPATFSGISSWADVDNDGSLDIFISGFATQGLVSGVFRNTTIYSNQAPSIPEGLSALSDDDKVYLKWHTASDDHTPSKAITYNLWIGTMDDAMDVASPHANMSNGKRFLPGPGNGVSDTVFFLQHLPQGKYYWSVQAIDNSGKASAFSPSQSFSICRKFSLGNDTIVCFRDSIVLNAGAEGEIVNWFNSGGAGIIAHNERSIKTEIIKTDTIWANIINTTAGCSTFDTIIVQANPVSIIDAGKDTSVCLNEKITLGGSPVAVGALLPYTYRWSPGYLLSDSILANPEVYGEEPATFRLIVKVGNCKADTAFVKLSINPLPEVGTIKDTSIGRGESVELHAYGADFYAWSPAIGLSDPYIPNPIAAPEESIQYILTGTNINGCRDTASVKIYVKNKLFIPSLFSPDGDGINDEFKIYGSGIKEITFRIFNRMGEQVYVCTDPEEMLNRGWDGRYKGDLLSGQSLLWTMDGKYFDGTDIKFNGQKSGTLILKR